jgi:hypothetical protein
MSLPDSLLNLWSALLVKTTTSKTALSLVTITAHIVAFKNLAA